MQKLIFNSLADIPALEKLGVSIEFEAENEDLDVYGHMEKESADYVVEQYENGNEAAWFCAKVTVSYKDMVETDYLGACSYKSFKEFKADPYYIDMISTCINEINRQVESINFGIQRKWNIRKAKRLIAPYKLSIVDMATVEKYAIV